MNRSFVRNVLVAPVVLLGGLALSACTLIQRPEPVTTLQLTLADAGTAWPATLAPGKVDATSALRSNRVLVVDRAVLMQHDGLRWADTPAVMLSEQLRVAHARSRDATAAVAAIDLWLTEFNLRVEPDRSNTVAVTAQASLRCIGSDRILTVPPVSASADPASHDPQALAEAFERASADVVSALLTQSAVRAADCATP